MNEVMVAVGACHGMYLLLQAILDEGDEAKDLIAISDDVYVSFSFGEPFISIETIAGMKVGFHGCL